MLRQRGRGRARLALVVVVLAVVSLLGAGSAAAATYTWDPFGPSEDFSNPGGWDGGVPPSGTVDTIAFANTRCGDLIPPQCVDSTDDIPGLQPNQLSFAGGSYDIGADAADDPLTVGSGGISLTPALGDTVVDLGVPLRLSAAQTWSITGGELTSPDTTGSYPLTIGLASQTTNLASVDLNGELGAVTIDGTEGVNDIVGLSGDLNGQDGQPVTISNAQIGGQGGTVGPLTIDSSGLSLGGGSNIIFGLVFKPLDVSGAVSLADDAVTASIASPGTDPGSDYGQLAATGNVTLTNTTLSLQPGIADICTAMNPGDVDALITTTGRLTGTFTGVANGSTVNWSNPCTDATGTQYQQTVTFRINYTANAVMATVVGDTGGTPWNILAPTITRSAVAGQTLTASSGTWTGSPTSYAYQWEDCVSGTCTAIANATGATYGVQPSDAGDQIEVTVTASNGDGVGPTVSSAPAGPGSGSGTLGSVPVNTSPPTISGTVTQGQTLTATPGSWTNSPTSYSYQWGDCDSAGSSCSPISGATGQTYTLTAADVGHTVGVLVVATNGGGGGAAALSAATATVLAPGSSPTVSGTGPAFTTTPSISGTAAVGRTLTAAPGSWTGTAPLSFRYQWVRCVSSCVSITGATGMSYTLTAADAGARITVAVVAFNAAGTGAALAPLVGPVARSSESAAQVRAMLTKLLSPPGAGATIPALLKAGGITLSTATPGAGSLVLDWYHLGAHGKRTLLADGRAALSASQTARTRLRLTAAGRRLLHASRRLTVFAEARYTAAGGAMTSATRTFTIQH